jgi:chromosome partitioning protein
VLFTQKRPAIRPRTQIAIETELREQGIPMFGTQLHERDPYRAIFAFGGTLRTLDTKQVRGVDAAVVDVEAFSREIIRRLDALAVHPKRERVA